MLWHRYPCVLSRDRKSNEHLSEGPGPVSRDFGFLCSGKELAKNSTEISDSARGLSRHPDVVSGKEAEDLGGILSRIRREKVSWISCVNESRISSKSGDKQSGGCLGSTRPKRIPIPQNHTRALSSSTPTPGRKIEGREAPCYGALLGADGVAVRRLPPFLRSRMGGRYGF